MMELPKKIARVLFVVTVLLAPFWVPNLLWHLAPESGRNVVVVDYTVPYDNYHSHRGLMWVLNYAKVPTPRPEMPWDPTQDYIGYAPDDRLNPVRLSQVDLGASDLLYFADAYGVYEMDLEILEGNRIQPTRSPRLFGGLSERDVDTIEAFVDSGGDLVTEFNTLPPPTENAERARLESLLDVRWTGWVGRVFPDLYDVTDVPDWFEGFFESRFPDRELPRDPALVLFSYSGELIVVSDPDYSNVAPRLVFTAAGRERLGGVRADAAYFKWFALFEAGTGAATLGELVLPESVLHDEGFHASGLPLRHPALTELVVGPSHRFAMAVDGGNVPFDPGRYRMAGVHRAQALLNRRKDLLSTRPAFWQFYVPAMRVILRE